MTAVFSCLLLLAILAQYTWFKGEQTNFFKELPKPVKFQFGITDLLSNLETSQVPSVGSLNMNIKVRILSMTKCKSEQIGIIHTSERDF